ncbi:DUF6447 family protein [Synechococcus sp. UW105]|uniref:DUF6447 family protein n=1 Tax=Synechococcus sp. UW105 TaxID=337067 RepID=UPI001FCC6E4F|nr:DUF6447 family protein [Synechococcus sp. UW105]
MLPKSDIAHTLNRSFLCREHMSDFMPSHMEDQNQEETASQDQVTNEDQQTLTLDGRVYAMNALPAEAINALNDLIRSENELNEHRFRMRQLSAAQQTLTAAIGQIIQAAGIEPISEVENNQSEESEAA